MKQSLIKPEESIYDSVLRHVHLEVVPAVAVPSTGTGDWRVYRDGKRIYRLEGPTKLNWLGRSGDRITGRFIDSDGEEYEFDTYEVVCDGAPDHVLVVDRTDDLNSLPHVLNRCNIQDGEEVEVQLPRGCIFEVESNLLRPSNICHRVTFTAYGDGDLPIIRMKTSGPLFNFGNGRSMRLSGIRLDSNRDLPTTLFATNRRRAIYPIDLVVTGCVMTGWNHIISHSDLYQPKPASFVAFAGCDFGGVSEACIHSTADMSKVLVRECEIFCSHPIQATNLNAVELDNFTKITDMGAEVLGTQSTRYDLQESRLPSPEIFIANHHGSRVAVSSDRDPNVTAYRWDWGDGTISHGSASMHIYREVGDYEIKLTAVSDAGSSSVKTLVSITDLGDPHPLKMFGMSKDGQTVFVGKNKAITLAGEGWEVFYGNPDDVAPPKGDWRRFIDRWL